VAWCIEYFGRESAKLISVSLPDLHIDTPYTVRFIARTDDGASGFFLQLQISIRMVGVIMRCENMGERPAFIAKRLFHGTGFWRIDTGRNIVVSVMDEHTVIVAAAGELMDFEVGHDEIRLFKNT
jgi:hypothetical protein